MFPEHQSGSPIMMTTMGVLRGTQTNNWKIFGNQTGY